MDNIKAIGGYFERDSGVGRVALPDGVLLNSGRNALRHIVRTLRVKQIHVPYYTCPVVWDALKAEGCELEFYEIGADFKPRKRFPHDDFVLYTNYFGCCGSKVDELAEDYPNLIVDNAQAYYARPKGRASFSSPRKFFGVPDGGIAYGVNFKPYGAEYLLDDSRLRMSHLDLRKKGEVEKGYAAFKNAEASLDGAVIMRMSQETRRILGHIDKKSYADTRISNFAFLDNVLHTEFPFHRSSDDVPMVYPYITDNPQLRSSLIQEKIYVASYWPGVCNCGNLRERILPLPIDQRYGEEDMERLLAVIVE